METKLYSVSAIGPDSVGLVENLSHAVTTAQGNIVDFRQDVIHGLFTVTMIVDLSASSLRLEDFKTAMEQAGEDTGLQINVSKYLPRTMSGERDHLGITLIGKDRPGVIAQVAKDLSRHNINIELSRAVGREDIFVMDLITCLGKSTLPLENLQKIVRHHMHSLGIQTMFQTEDVFNPQKKAILFALKGNLLVSPLLHTIIEQAELTASDLPSDTKQALEKLDGLPQDVFDQILDTVQPTNQTFELIHTLHHMGYRVGLYTLALNPIAERIQHLLRLDYAQGPELPLDHDTKTIDKENYTPFTLTPEQALTRFQTQEQLPSDSITLLCSSPGEDDSPPGIRLSLDTRKMLELFNDGVLNARTLSGLLSSFGVLKA